MSRRPAIGVTTSTRGAWRIWPFHWLALKRAGARPVKITPDRPVGIDTLDGLVIGGGDDISAHLYGGEITPDVRIDPERDQLEQTLLHTAFERGMPVLGICRGAQMVNVTLGGSLHVDIYTSFENVPRMRTVLARKTVSIDQDSRLGEIMACNPCRVNALHHQSIERLGEGLRIVARDDHGIVQGVESRSAGRFLIGVQWHPELLVFSGSHQRLFKALGDAARGFAAQERKRAGVDERVVGERA